MSALSKNMKYLMERYLVEGLLTRAPIVGNAIQEYKRLQRWARASGYEPGHFYSPIPSIPEIKKNADRIFSDSDPLGINLNARKQFDLLQVLEQYRESLPYNFLEGTENPHLRYRWTQGCQYRYSDVVFLYSVIRHLRPKRIIEVGSGASSAVMLDIAELFFGSSIQMTFIDPYPKALYSFLREADKATATILECEVQDVPIDLFLALEENDILFIDSSHVVKVGSDVNHIVFEVLPRLRKGVWVHFHDIFFPFELPVKWIVDHKKFWNEIYLLRAFLMYNEEFEIVLFNTFLQRRFRDWFEEKMPECLLGEDPVGSIWIRKIR